MRTHNFSGSNVSRKVTNYGTLLEEGVASGYGTKPTDIHTKILRHLAKLRKQQGPATA